MQQTKEVIKKAYEHKMQLKEKICRIESKSERTVHFIFNPNVTTKVSPFNRKYKWLLDGTLAEQEEQERVKFAAYLEAMENETLSEEEPYPVVFGDMPWFSCELTGLSRISFSVADDPFFKASRAKYYPEIYLVNKKSEIKEYLGPYNRQSSKYSSAFEYCEDFRDLALKVNDDRKIKINLSEIMKNEK